MAVIKDISNDKATQAKINKELRRLNAIFKNVSSAKKDTVKSLISSAAFMAVMLDELEKHIAEHGVISEYQNGANQWGTKKSPEFEAHATMIKNHSTVIRQLTDLIQTENIIEDDGFDAFLLRREG